MLVICLRGKKSCFIWLCGVLFCPTTEKLPEINRRLSYFSDQANNANDPNTAYNIFIDKYTGLFDACFPFKTIKGKALNSFSTYIIMMLYLFLLLKSFKLETRFINIQQDTLTFTDLIPVEQILKNFRSCFKVLEYGIHYQTTSKMPRLLVYSSV